MYEELVPLVVLHSCLFSHEDSLDTQWQALAVHCWGMGRLSAANDPSVFLNHHQLFSRLRRRSYLAYSQLSYHTPFATASVEKSGRCYWLHDKVVSATKTHHRFPRLRSLLLGRQPLQRDSERHRLHRVVLLAPRMKRAQMNPSSKVTHVLHCSWLPLEPIEMRQLSVLRSAKSVLPQCFERIGYALRVWLAQISCQKKRRFPTTEPEMTLQQFSHNFSRNATIGKE
mmetsp:Transcript_15691/g.23082  ORF Transcript_15691/g.23082 Transcript_15691/m.23082 type:complete len:227 (-) Transcript_15691:1778-2458(-)